MPVVCCPFATADSFLGQFWWGEDGPGSDSGSSTATAVVIEGQDHLIDSCVIFSAAVGIELNGGAALVASTHIYNGGGPSLVVRGQEVRVIGCYFDFNPVVLVDPVAVDISHSYFLGAVGIELRSSGSPEAFVSGLQITHNQFIVGSADPRSRVGVWVNETAGRWSNINQTLVADNVYPPATYGDWKGLSVSETATHISRTQVVKEANASSFLFDLKHVLLFECTEQAGGIASALHGVLLPLGSRAHWVPKTAIRLGDGCTLIVESDSPLPKGTRVSVTVDQFVDS
eukprot:5670365-Prymnesium_polylepis.1